MANTAKSILDGILKEAGGKAKIESLFKKLAKGQVDAEVKSIATWIASKITGQVIAQAAGRRAGVAPSGFAAYPAPKSFTLTIGLAVSGLSPYVVGGMAEVRFGLAADLGKDSGKPYDARGYFHVAVGVGGGVPGIDAALNIQLGLSPAKTDAAAGPFFGIFAEAGAGVGVEIEAEWSISKDITAMPGLAVGVGAQDPAPGGAVMLNGGWACTFGANSGCL